jgi:hypothetical protein
MVVLPCDICLFPKLKKFLIGRRNKPDRAVAQTPASTSDFYLFLGELQKVQRLKIKYFKAWKPFFIRFKVHLNQLQQAIIIVLQAIHKSPTG